jgi:hypothetical protein
VSHPGGEIIVPEMEPFARKRSVALEPLWKLDETLLALMESIETCPEELKPELQADIELYLGKEVAKIDQTAHVLAALEYEEKAANDEIVRLGMRMSAARNARKRLEDYLCRIIAARGGKPLKGSTSTLISKPSDAVEITDANLVPRKFKTATVKLPLDTWIALFEPYEEIESATIDISISKADIKKALKAGEDVPGADLEFRSNLQRK